MKERILSVAQDLKNKTIARRRDFHKYAESAWTEFRTASIVFKTLSGLGYDVYLGEEVIKGEDMMNIVPPQELERHMTRAVEQGADPRLVGRMKGGKTGVVGIMKFAEPGPVVALRFDMDATEVEEAADDNHRPWREKFASVNRGIMHACGHDGHTAIGLSVAEALSLLKDSLKGTVKLIFQPAEEGVCGAKSMTTKGIVDDVDYFIGMHLGLDIKKTGQITCSVEGFLATSKIDAIFTGISAHAGAAPEDGRNALLAAAAASLNLHAVSRHSQGASRINVGILNAGTGRNVIPANAVVKLETRGATTEIDRYMYHEARRVLAAAAQMYGVEVDIRDVGGATSAENDPDLVKRLEQAASATGVFEEIIPSCNFGASEDCSCFMERVQQKGGQAAYVLIGTARTAAHHNHHFDFDEEALTVGVIFLTSATAALLNESRS